MNHAATPFALCLAASIGLIAGSVWAQAETPMTSPAPEVVPNGAASTQPASPTSPPSRAPTADSVPATPEGGASDEQLEGSTLTFDLGLGSAYMWRGANLWGNRTSTQHLSLFPSVTYANGNFSALYWGAYQLTGKNKGDNLDAGAGAEQDLGVSYELPVGEQLSALFALTAYVWPLAKKDVAGANWPAALEPGVTLSYETKADLALFVGYYRGLQDATDAFSHVYLNPQIGKELELTDTLTLNLAAGAGYKIWTSSAGQDADENDFDLLGNVGVTYTRGDLYVTPAMHASWTDIEGQSTALWGTVNVGYGVALR